MATLVMNLIMGSVILLMLGAGLRVTFGEVLGVVRQAGAVTRGVLANFVITPFLIFLAIQWLPISVEVKIGIMLMAAAPVAPMAPAPFVEIGKGDLAYSLGLMIIVATLSVVLTPLILSLGLPSGEGGFTLDPLEIVKTLLIVQLIPISVGMTIRRGSAKWADRLFKFVPKIGQLGLLVGVGLLLASKFQDILSIELLSHLAMLALVVLLLVVGDLMMAGQSPERRRALAIVTAIRNVPLAFLIANASFGDSVAGPVTLVFSVYTMIGAVIYAKLVLRGQSESAETETTS